MPEKTTKVFLGNSPWKRDGAYGVRAGSRWPHFEFDGTPYMPFPFFLAYATSVLKQNNFTTLAVDAIAEGISEKEFISRIVAFAPDIIVLEISSASIGVDIQMLQSLRKIYGRDFPIIWCGAHSWSENEPDVLQQVSEIDFFIKGEYELALLDLCKKLETGERDSFGDVKGLFWRDRSRKSIDNPKRNLVENLETFPLPERDDFPMNRYMEAAGGLPWPNLQMWASRGCPFRCNFCVWPQFMYNGRNYRTRNPKALLDEVEIAVKKYGMKSVYFDDDTFNIGKKRIIEISDEFIKRKLGIPWGAMSRADTFDRVVFEKMVESGLKFIKFGVESGDQKIVDRMEKALNLNKVRESMKWAKELGVKTHLTFSFGHIGETMESAKKTIDFALELSPDSLQFSLIQPFPGSDLYKDLEKMGHLDSKDYAKYDGYTSSVISTDTLSSKQLEKILETANRKWQRHTLMKIFKTQNWSKLKWAATHPQHAFRRVMEIMG